MAINSELRRRKGLDAAAAPAEEQQPLSPAERDAAIAARKAQVKAEVTQIIGRDIPQGQKPTKAEISKARAAAKAAKAEQARIQADKDAALLPEPLVELPPINGRTLTLHEQNQLRKLRERNMRDENREIVAAVAKAASDTLGNVVDRRRHSRARRAMDLQQMAAKITPPVETKGAGFTGLYAGQAGGDGGAKN